MSRPLASYLLEMGAQERLVFAEVERAHPDEPSFLLLCAKRIVWGQNNIGRFDLANDPRDFKAEGLEERADMVIYAGCDVVQERLRGR